MTTRRKFLGAGASLTTIAIAGCMNRDARNQPADNEDEPSNDNESVLDDINVDNPQPASNQEFNDWSPDTNCEGNDLATLDSEISISEVTTNIEDTYNPISYDSLPHSQKELLAIALTEGGYATCETSDAFNTFLENAVEQAENQEVYLEYNNKYYRLYLRKLDQVYAY